MPRYFTSPDPSGWPSAAGFRSDAQSVHGSRTTMLADLTALLDVVPPSADHEAYRRAVQDENVLARRTASTRLWAYKKLRELYALDPAVPLFSELRTRWSQAGDARPLVALLVALARDGLLRASVPVIASAAVGTPVDHAALRAAIVSARGERFSDTTLQAVTSHLLTSWADAGHLDKGRARLRTRVAATPAATTLALTLGHLAGARGAALFDTVFARVLDAPVAALHDRARDASRLGWLSYRGTADIVEVDFPHLRHADTSAAVRAG